MNTRQYDTAPPNPGQTEAGFYCVLIDLGNWAALHEVQPSEAAALLLGYNPDKSDSTGADFVMLGRRFADHAQKYPEPRRLAQWWALALGWKKADQLHGIRLSPDLGMAIEYLDAKHYPAPEPAQTQEAARKGTSAKLTDAQKDEIVELYNRGRGMTVNQLAKRYEVARPTIDRALIAAGVKVKKTVTKDRG
ncbi:MAG: hypothetical protein QM569_03795 [Acidovorax sp.]|uniref:hypothetical protein n=1 Tax=Acidovorax sp. TaxID=1872122 RepID=UPI0039E480AA